MKIICSNKINSFEITINLKDKYLDDGNIFVNPMFLKYGIISILKKHKIIKEIIGIASVDNKEIPIAKINNGKLREFDRKGTNLFLERKNNES